MLDGLTFIINGKLEISWNDDYYKSNIENTDDKSIYISIPIKDGKYIPLRIGEQIEVFYYFENDIYKFYSVVTDRQTDRIPLILIEIPKEVVKIQRRRFVRVPLICDIEYFMERTKSVSLKPFKAIMIDLSGGGMKIKLSEEVKLGSKIVTHIPLGNEKLILKGEVVRIDKDEDKKKSICGVSFTDLDERKREKLIRFIFKVMREQMNKGK
ncbi:flagellar brake protein [Candidatus Clostridium stratigraminis]|uniref:Flagellar brake protein n=1 Tax=Candidatus Clostridium stratigraminis TaxID=3381661 RepID=A0ABW8T2K7_9CLOT